MSLQNLLLKDFGWKLASFLLALVIWGVVKVTIQSEIRMGGDGGLEINTGEFKKLPVTLLREPGDVRPLQVTPREVDVVISGDPSDLRRIRARQIEAFVKLADSRTLRAAPQKIIVTAPPGITVVRVAPAEVLVTPTGSNDPSRN